jgi:hypothetical protein
VISGRVSDVPDASARSVVTAYAEPDLSRLRSGRSAPLIRLGVATADASGCYAIDGHGLSTWRAAQDASGGVEVRLVVHQAGRILTRSVPITLTATAAGPRIRPTESGTGTTGTGGEAGGAVFGHLRVDFGPGARARVVAPRAAVVGPTVSSGSAAEQHDVIPTSPTVTFAGGGLRWVLRQDFGKRSTVVGQWWSGTKNTVQRWKYARGTRTRLGAAWSVGGGAGSFTGSRTWSQGVDAKVAFPKIKGKAGILLRSFFKYGLYDLQQYDYVTGRWHYIATWIRQTRWVRGTDLTTGLPVPRSPRKWCSPYHAGSSDQTSLSTAVEWTNGVQLSPAMKGLLVGLDLSSRTGFTTTARNKVTFTGPARLCGRYGPLSKPGALIGRRPL